MAKHQIKTVKDMERFCKAPVGDTTSIKISGSGSLFVRNMSKGTRYYFQYKHGGKLRRYPFGAHDARDGDSQGDENATRYTLPGAKLRAERLATIHKECGDVINYMADKREEAEEVAEASRESRKHRKQLAKDYSLKRLCEAYGDHLSAQDKPSALTVKGALQRWVTDKHADLASKKASDVTTDDVLEILRTVIEAGHTTMTNRLRSYLSAAYSFGIGSTTDPLINSRAGGFQLTYNPVAVTKPVQSYENAGERDLSGVELGELLRRFQMLESREAKAALLCLRLGGQRITQLLAVTPRQFDTDNEVITLLDGKGRRNKPRKHVVPIIDAAKSLFEDGISNQHPRRSGLWSGLSRDTVCKLVSKVSTEMESDGFEPFTMRDLRRTCETQLAAMGISKDLRAQIQSHGLSGVQAKHYDKHDYLEEKRTALVAWNQRLDELVSCDAVGCNVVELVR